jgi:hypothetical protein
VNVDDETLMAFADGELPEPRMREVGKAVAADPALQARLARFQEVRARVAALADAAPGPRAGLMEAARQSAAARRGVSPRTWGLALAASLAGVAVVVGLTRETAQRPERASGVLAVALERTPSGETLDRGGLRAAPLYTVVAADGRPCRGFRTLRDGVAREGAACRTDGSWRILAAEEVEVPYASSAFAQASSQEPPSVTAAVDALDAGPPLGDLAERRLMARRWSRE